MIHISVALTLLALTGGMFLLFKVKSESLGMLAKVVAYLIIVLSSLMLVFDITHVVMGRGHGHGCHGMNCCAGEGGMEEGCHDMEGHEDTTHGDHH